MKGFSIHYKRFFRFYIHISFAQLVTKKHVLFYNFKSSAQYYRKRGSASYIVREVHSVRERERERERYTEREREREKEGSDVTIVALKLAMSFALLLAKNVHLSIGEEFCAFPCQKFAPQFFPSRMALSSHFPLPKTLHFSKQFAFFALSHGVIDRRSKQQSKRSNFRLHRSSLSSKNRKNESN